MSVVMNEVADPEHVARGLEDEIAEVCGLLNATTARLVSLIARVLASGVWMGAGIRTAEQWVAWQCGVSPRRARALVAMAGRLPDLPSTASAFDAGALSEDQVRVVCRHTEAHNDTEVAELARNTTVSQLQRTLRDHRPTRDPDPTDSDGQPPPPEPRTLNFGYDDDRGWSLNARGPLDEGALIEQALNAARQDLYTDAEDDTGRTNINWFDALLLICERSLDFNAGLRPRRDRYTALLHLRTTTPDSGTGNARDTDTDTDTDTSTGSGSGSGRSGTSTRNGSGPCAGSGPNSRPGSGGGSNPNSGSGSGSGAGSGAASGSDRPGTPTGSGSGPDPGSDSSTSTSTDGQPFYAYLHGRPALPDSLRRYLTCDGHIRPIHEVDGIPVNVGRTQRSVPDRTRTLIEDRDRGCRVPGCDRHRWLHIHHITHWEDGGKTNTDNLIALCPRHHRQHHQHQLGITGNPDQPHGVTFTDHQGRPLTGSGQPVPPSTPPHITAQQLDINPGTYTHPTGEHLHTKWVAFTDPPSPN